MITTQTIELSMTPEITVLPEVYCSQYDNGIRQVVFELFTDAEKTTPYNVDGMTAIVEGTKPDGNAYAVEAQASGSSVTVTITTQMAAVAGIVPSEVIIRNGAQRVGSLNFLLMVEQAGILDDAIVSDSEIPPYVESAKESAEAAAASQAAAAASQAAAAASQAAAAASQAAAAASQAAAASSETNAASSEEAAASSETAAAASAEAAEYWAKQSMEGKTLATLPDVDLNETSLAAGDALYYEGGRWTNGVLPIFGGGTGNADGYIRAGQVWNKNAGEMATAEGKDTNASGAYSHAEGDRTEATGICSHTEGRLVKAEALYSHAGGLAVINRPGGSVCATKQAEFVQGLDAYNIYDKKQLKFKDSAPEKNLFGFMFGYAPAYSRTGQATIYENTTIDCIGGASATITEVTTVTLTLRAGAIYLLFCNAFTLSNGALYGATARMISCLPTADGTPNNLSLGQTSAAPATIAFAANHTVTIQNAAAARATQFTLIRVA